MKKSPTTCTRVDRDLAVEVTRVAGRLTAEMGENVTASEVFSIAARRGLPHVTAAVLTRVRRDSRGSEEG